MPIVTIQIARDGATSEQKAALTQGGTDLIAHVLSKPSGLTFVVIQEFEAGNWGVESETLPFIEVRLPGRFGSSSPD